MLEGLERIEAAERRLAARGIERAPTFFEVATALAFDHFSRSHVRQAVVEVGLGGRLDSTNVLRAPVGVVVTIELEHTDILGPTLGAIAGEKAGILHPGMRAVVGELPHEAWETVRRTASTLGVPVTRLGVDVRVLDRSIGEDGQRVSIELPGRTLRSLKIPLAGTFQATNAALAAAAADLFARSEGFQLPDATIREGLAGVEWPGRLERIARRPDVYVDVAHTPESARALSESLLEIRPLLDPPSNAVVFGCLEGKRVEAILSLLSNLATTVVLVPVRSDRGLSPSEVRRGAAGRFPRIVVADSVARGLAVARAATSPTGFTLVTGSDYLVGEVLDITRGPVATEPDLSDPTVRAEAAAVAEPPPGRAR
jgi:dihydrofolate synthase/folylpolyglutamate synthase